MAYKTQLVSVTKISNVIVTGNKPSGLDGSVTNEESGNVSPEAGSGGVSQSSNGRYVVFTSEATSFDSVEGSSTDTRDIFLKDMVTGNLTRITTGGFGPDSSDPEVSDDGLYISYQTNNAIYRYDVTSGSSVQITNNGADPHMSADGRYITFNTPESGGISQVYLKDMQSGTTTLISADSSGAGNGDSSNAYVSNDGKYVVFQSASDDFDAGNKNPYTEVFLKNVETGELRLISQTADGAGGVTNGSIIFGSGNAMISGNGRYVVFESGNNDLAQISNVNGTDAINSAIYRKDLVTGNVDLVSEGKTGDAAVGATDASISADGRFVLFKTGYGAANDGSLSTATSNLSPNYFSYWYVKDMANGDVHNIDLPGASTNTKLTVLGRTIVTPTVYLPPYESLNASISADGKYITLSSTQSLDKGLIPLTNTADPAFTDIKNNNDLQYDVFRLDISSITSKAATGQTQTGSNNADTLVGGMGPDKLVGLNGDDTYVVEIIKSGTGAAAAAKLKDTVVEAANMGYDGIQLIGSVLDLTKASTITLAANVEQIDASATGLTLLNLTGNALDNRIFGNDAANILDGGVGADELFGGKGNDTYKIDNENDKALEDSIAGAEGIDTLEVNIASAGGAINLDDSEFFVGIENVTLLNKVAFDIYGNSLDNHFIGNAAVNTVLGDDGNDTLDGGVGADTLIGGAGNDVYIVDNLLDEVLEGISVDPQNPEIDRVEAKVSYSIEDSGEVENLTLLASATAINATGNSLKNTITGNTGANKLFGLGDDDKLIGGAGNDTLDGGTGADDMQGEAGDDTYLVDDEDDLVTEAAGATGGKDTIISSISIEALTANVENLTLIGSAANGFGNALSNTITGNDANNQLGDESGVYGPLVDTLIGGKGDDIYHVGMLMSGTGTKTVIRMKDVVTETAVAGSGFDRIKLHGEITQDALGSAITVASNITLGANLEGLDIDFTGATLLNVTGNAAGNELIGNAVKNVINGLGGDDFLIGDEGNDTLDGGLGNDTLEGNTDNDSLTGGAGTDSLVGGSGDDVYVVNIKVVVTGIGAVAQLEDAILEESGTDTLKLTGSATLVNATTFTLAGELADIEHIDASGTASTKINLTGNDQANYLTGNAAINTLTGGLGNDTLDGGLGNDSLIGGDGNDLYIVSAVGDVVTENGLVDSDDDTVQGGINLDLANYAGVEHITLTGTTIINAKGNAGNNRIVGNSAANTLDGSTGADRLTGGAGNDTYIVDDAADVVDEAIAGTTGGADLVKLASTYNDNEYVLATNVESLDATAYISNIELQGNLINNLITAGIGNDTLLGGDGNDTLVGGNGDDVLDGGLGTDNLQGGTGNDAYSVNLKLVGTLANVTVALEDSITDTAGTSDTLNLFGGAGANKVSTVLLAAALENLDASAAAVNGEVLLNLTGNASANNITGSHGNNTIFGLAGNDSIDGLDGSDSIDGGTGDDSLLGGDGNDTLVGGTGIDTLLGGDGDDTYVVALKTTGTGVSIIASLEDTIDEDSSGSDTLKLTGSATLSNTNTLLVALTGDLANIDNIDASGTVATKLNLTGNATDNYLTGNTAINILMGGAGDDTLDGGAGADSMDGGSDDDTYYVDNLGDTITDSSGIDTVIVKVAAAAYTLNTGLENFILTGTTAINGNGNELNNTLTGNGAANLLDGKAGADAMDGAAGNDTYIVDDEGDTVTESLTIAQGGGSDLVKSSVTFTLSANVDNLTLTDGTVNTGTTSIDGIGNELNNVIIGNAGHNILSGNAGKDNLTGGLGDDTLDGGNGNDTLTGGAGNDVFVFNTAPSAITNIDTIADFVKGSDLIQIDTSVFSALAGASVDSFAVGAGLIAAPNPQVHLFYNTTTGTLYYDADGQGGQAAVAFANLSNRPALSFTDFQFTDSIVSNVSYTLGSNDLSLRLTGNSYIDGTGNTLNNLLIGNAVSNTLDGLGGDDTMIGGDGYDIYIVDSTNDVVIETNPATLNANVDEVRSSATFTLGANLEILTLTGNADINGTGNAIANDIYGNIGNNILDGGGGHDVLFGGQGDDTYIVDILSSGSGSSTVAVFADEVYEDFGDGVDTIQLRGNITLTNFTELTLDEAIESLDASATGTTKLNLIGNTQDNLIKGNSASNILQGLEGNDTLDGGVGADTLYGGNDNDTYIVDNVGDVVIEAADAEVMQANDSSSTAIFSPEGKFVAFSSTASNLLPGNTDFQGISEIFLKNLITGEIQSITNTANGQQANGNSGPVAFSNDGHLLMFASSASNLVVGDNNGMQDIFIRNLDTDEIKIATTNDYQQFKLDAQGREISADGKYQLFSTRDQTLTGQYNVSPQLQIFVKNLQTDELTYVSFDSNGVAGNGDSFNAVFSDDGHSVIFASGANNLAGGSSGLFKKDLLTGSLELISTVGTTLSPDGINVLFSGDPNLIPGSPDDGLYSNDIYVKNLQTGVIQRVTSDANGVGGDHLTNSNSTGESFSADGRYVVFSSYSTNLVPNDTNFSVDIFVKDLLTGDIQRVSTTQGQIGTDTVLSSVSYTLAANVENLTLTGSANINGTGNDLNNIIIGNSGANNLSGGAGDDYIDAGVGGYLGNLSGGLGNDTLIGGGSLNGNEGDDTLIGKDDLNNEILSGGEGNDYLDGGLGVLNTLIGNEGNDTLVSGSGQDWIYGGSGADTFVFNAIDGGATAIFDFSVSEGDRLLLSQAAMPALNNTGNLNASNFEMGAGLTAATSQNTHIFFDTTTGNLYYDADGSGAAASQLIALISSAGDLNGFSAGSIFLTN